MSITSVISGALAPTVTHELHRAHTLSLVNTHHFQCDVCKRYGEGEEHYRCDPCNFDAHTDCATAPDTFKHANYAGIFKRYRANGSGHYCGLCGREALGFLYQNHDVDDCCLHPCCAFMPAHVVQDGRTFQLGYHPSGMCGMCKKKSTASLSYRSTYDDGEDLYLHVRCLVDTNDRLTGYQDWVAKAPIRPGVMVSFTRKKEGGDLMKVAKVSVNIVRMVVHAVTLDVEGIVEAAQNVAEVFDGE